MPRNSSGIYQLPAGNPVVSGTLIESIWANSTMPDVAQALTDSLDRFGRSTMAAPLLLNDGTLAAPGVAFGAETSTGLWRKSAKVLSVSAGGMEVATFSQAGVTLPKGIIGNVAFTGDLTTTGGLTLGPGKSISAPGATSGSWSLGHVGATGGAVLNGTSDAGATVDINALTTDGTSGATIRMFRSTTTTGARTFTIMRGDNSTTVDHLFACGASVTSSLARGGGKVLIGTSSDLNSDNLQVAGTARVRTGVAGTVGNANYANLVVELAASGGMSILAPAAAAVGLMFCRPSFTSAGGILYDHATDLMTLQAASAVRATLGATSLLMAVQINAVSGTVAAPGLSLGGNHGLWRLNSTQMGVAVAGTETARFMNPSGDAQFLVGNPVAATMAATGRGFIEINGATTSLLAFDVAAANAAYLVGTATALTLATVGARVMSFATAGAEVARFTSASMGEFLINTTTTGTFSLANRALLAMDGTVGALIGLSYNAVRNGWMTAATATEFRLSSALNCALTLCYNSTEVARVDTDSTFKYAGNEVGWRGLPMNTKAVAYTLVAADCGKCVVQTAAATINVPAGSVFGAGDVVSVCNKTSASNITLGQLSGVTINWGSPAATGNRTLGPNALVTLFFTAANVCTLTGSGIT